MSSQVEFNRPGDFDPYGGAGKSHQTSNERIGGEWVHYFSQQGESPAGFGVHVFRQVGLTGRAAYVWYNGSGPLLSGRGDLDLDGDGTLQINGSWSDKDEDGVSIPILGYVPFSAGSGPAPEPTNGPDISVLTQQIAALTQQVLAAQAAATAAMARANYVKEVYEPVWATLTALSNRPVGLSRDDAWQLAGERVYGDLGDPQSGIAGRVQSAVKIALSGIGAPAIDADARSMASTALAGSNRANAEVNAFGNRVVASESITNEALKRATDARTLAGQAVETAQSRVTLLQVKEYIDAQWTSWVTYADPKLLNLLWDRAVKLLRYKEKTGKNAEQLPINDPRNLLH